MTVDSSAAEGAVEQEPDTEAVAESAAPDTTDTSVSESDANQDPADSSTADGKPEGEGDTKPESLLEAITEASKPDKPETDSPAVEKGKQDQEDKPDTELSQDDKDKALPFHDHPRWKEVVTERDKFKAEAAENEEASTAITRLETFLTEKNLTVEEFNNSLQISALMRNDPHAALQALTPYYQALLEVTGTTLPKDLQDAVEGGTISQNYAQEVAKSRAGQTLATQKVAQTEQRFTQQQATERNQTLSTTASAWETEKSSSDPDYSKKAELVRENLELRWRQGDVPQDAAAMRAQCDSALKAVETRLRTFLPKRSATTPSPTIGAAGNPAPVTPPKTLEEAMERAIGG